MIKAKYVPPSQFCSPFELIHSMFRQKKRLPDWWSTALFNQTLCFHRARTCVAFACEYLGIPPESEVLIPAYNCGSEIDPLLHMGIKVVMYDVNRQGRIDIDDIVRRITVNTRAVYVTHYFGWPQDLANLANICRSHNLRLIEDCALSLFSQSDITPIGQFCDAAIFSLPKFLPVPDGGFLALHATSPLPLLNPPLTGEILSSLLPFLKRWIFSSFRVSLLTTYSNKSKTTQGENEYPDIPKSYYYDSFRYYRAMSKTTSGLLNLLDIEKIIKIRRQNYLTLFKVVSESDSIRPLFNELPVGVCPVMFPLLVKNRDTMVAWFKERGITTFPWWSGYHRNLNWSEFPDAQYLKNHVLCLPVHQNLNETHLNHITQCLLEWNSIQAS